MEKARDINLIPFDVMMKEKMKRRIWLWSIMIPLFITVLAGIAVVGNMKVSDAEEALHALSIQQQEARDKAAELRVLHDKRDQLLKKAVVVSSLGHTKSISSLFYVLEQSMNRGVWLTSFRFHNNDGKLNDDSPNKGKSQAAGEDKMGRHPEAFAYLKGMAHSNKDLAGFLHKLSRSGSFSDVKMKYSEEGEYEGRNVVEFEIVAYPHRT